jgi:peptidoglycan/xylan/chitin deacetylase (PgdA/CDA1 family)
MKLEPLTSWQIQGGDGSAPGHWAAGLRVKAPAGFFDDPGGALRLAAPPAPRYDATRLAAFRERALWIENPPASARLPFPYHRVPTAFRVLAARIFGKMRRQRLTDESAFPIWPLDLSVDFLADLAGFPPAALPAPGRVLLTHDIDSAEGLANLVNLFLPLEEKYGARSVNYIVPCKWPLDQASLDEIISRGHRLGIHGFDHGNRTPFCGDEERRRRIEAARPLVERHKIKGYRAPSLCRTPALIDELARHYAYDSSVPASGGLFPAPDNGCASARPFLLRGLLEIPLTMPRDGSLLFLGHAPEAILELWKQCAMQLARSGGLVVVLTHCEKHFSGNPAMLRAYEGFLAFVREQSNLTFVQEDELLDSIKSA